MLSNRKGPSFNFRNSQDLKKKKSRDLNFFSNFWGSQIGEKTIGFSHFYSSYNLFI